MAPQTAPYGLWKSPLDASKLAAEINLVNTYVDRQTGAIYWSEGRPQEGGREVVVSSEGKDLTPPGSNTRSRVNGYGGGAAAVGHGRLILSDFASNSVFEVLVDGSKEHKRIVPENDKLEYADFDVHPSKANLILAIKQDETNPDPSQQPTTLVLIDSNTSTVTTLVEGNDFYSAPRWNNDGSKVCWVEWSHPYMPFEGTELWVADISGHGQLENKQKIAGQSGQESISQPRWALDGKTLLFLSDASGYYQLHTWSPGKEVSALGLKAKRDLGGPFAQSSYAPLNPDQVLVKSGSFELSLINIKTGSSTPLELPIEAIYEAVHVASPQLVVAIARPLSQSAAVIAFDPTAAQITFKTLKSSSKVDLDSGYISVPKQISYPAGPDPGQSGMTEAYAWFYEPANKDYQGPSGEKPPLVVRIHGGPTSSATPALQLSWQFFTSRGFAFADVNYGGSTGFGRDFKDRLHGQWGVVDPDDSVACVKYLAEQGLVDGKRAVITGQSSGGLTLLAAIVRHPDVYAGAASLFGIGDLKALGEGTHKFESQYLFGLMGGKPEEIPEVYHDRSPVNHAKEIKTPTLLLQGDKDVVVPPAQATQFKEALDAIGTRCELVRFPNEGHGFREASSIIESYNRQLEFFLDVLKIKA